MGIVMRYERKNWTNILSNQSIRKNCKYVIQFHSTGTLHLTNAPAAGAWDLKFPTTFYKNKVAFWFSLYSGSQDGLVVINRTSHLCYPGSTLASRSYVSWVSVDLSPTPRVFLRVLRFSSLIKIDSRSITSGRIPSYRDNLNLDPRALLSGREELWGTLKQSVFSLVSWRTIKSVSNWCIHVSTRSEQAP